MNRILRPVFAAALATVGAGAAAWVSPASAAPALLQQVAPFATVYPASTLTYSAAGDVTAAARPVDVQIPPGPNPDSSTSGCEAADFAGFPPGQIAIIQRGTCTLAVKAQNARLAGASAVVIFNEGQAGRTEQFEGTLGAPITIPVVATSFTVGQQLVTLAPSGLILRVATPSDVPLCDAPPATGTPIGGRNVIVAQPGMVTLGTEGADVIYGTAGVDMIAALGGDDIVFGLGGNDQIVGGDGADTLCGDEGNDDVAGGPGADMLYGGPGANRLAGEEGTDACEPSASAQTQLTGCEIAQTAV